MPSAADDVRSAIERAGSIPFDEFMRLALYGEHGFYQVVGHAGRRGDFITAPEVGPLFGAVLARAIDGWWSELGEPDGFTVVEVGAGPGTLARSIAAAEPRFLESGRYVAVETSATQRSHHPGFVESMAEVPRSITCGVVLANELLDNLPFRLFVFDGGWREANVAVAKSGDFVEILGDVVDTPPGFPRTAPHGSRLPLQEGARTWIAEMIRRLETGRLVVFDYCSLATADLVEIPWRSWLRTYRQQERGSHYLRDVGLQDITTQVCLDQLGLPDARVSTQRDFLHRHGIDELVEEGREYWEEHRSAPDLRAMTMRSRVREAEALCDAAGLGGFTVIEVTK